MATWQKKEIVLEDGRIVDAQHPQIISASRSTDIPAFYCDWFFLRLEKGYSAWTNPFNGAKSYVAYDQTRFIVFWSKNPHLSFRIETFKELVRQLGKGGVIWRFDPLILTDKISMDDLLVKIENIGDQLRGYTEKLVFSFADITVYRKVKKNLDDAGVHYLEWTKDQMIELAKRLVALNKRKGWNYTLATCGEAADFEGVEHNHCIDDALMIKRAHNDKVLMDFLKVKMYSMPQLDIFGESDPLLADAIVLDNGKYATRGDNKDKGQREFCGCMKAKDIGQYNTCIHKCEYCYANDNKAIAMRNFEMHKQNPTSETITGT